MGIPVVLVAGEYLGTAPGVGPRQRSPRRRHEKDSARTGGRRGEETAGVIGRAGAVRMLGVPEPDHEEGMEEEGEGGRAEQRSLSFCPHRPR